MKYLLFLFFIVLPVIGFCQQQRLGIIPSGKPIILTRENPSGSVASFCSDGHTRSVKSATTAEFIHFQSPENIEVIVDGAVFPGGISELIEKGIITIDTYGAHSVIFMLNKTDLYTTISINFLKPNVVADRAGDFAIEKYWLTLFTELNILPPEITTFEKASEYIKALQSAYNLEVSGLLTDETKYLLQTLKGKKNILEETGYLTSGEPFLTENFRAAEKRFQHDYAVDDIRDMRYFLYDRVFLNNFKNISYDNSFPGEKYIKTRNARQIYHSEPRNRKVLSRAVKTYDKHKTHYYIIQTPQGPIKIKLLKNEHTFIINQTSATV